MATMSSPVRSSSSSSSSSNSGERYDADEVMQRAEGEIRLSRRRQTKRKLFIAAIVALVAVLGIVLLHDQLAAAASATTATTGKATTSSSTSRQEGVSFSPESSLSSSSSTDSPTFDSTFAVTEAGSPAMSTITFDDSLSLSPNSLPLDESTTSPTSAPIRRPPTPSPTPPTPGCIPTDRFDNENMNKNNRLFAGQYVCSDNNQYRFGLTERGDLFWKDTEGGQTVTYVTNEDYTDGSNNNPVVEYYFSVRIDGTFVLHKIMERSNDNSSINDVSTTTEESTVWELQPKFSMGLTEGCLTDHDCPYLHLHDDGVMVLNFIDPTTHSWIPKNVKRAFDFPNL